MGGIRAFAGLAAILAFVVGNNLFTPLLVYLRNQPLRLLDDFRRAGPVGREVRQGCLGVALPSHQLAIPAQRQGDVELGYARAIAEYPRPVAA